MSAEGTVEQKLSLLGLFTSPSAGTWSVSDGANGNKILHDVPVFRAGTFRDSLGLQRTWDPEHLFQMVQNFEALRAKGILPNVPVRVDHSFSADKVIGWITGMRVKPSTPNEAAVQSAESRIDTGGALPVPAFSEEKIA